MSASVAAIVTLTPAMMAKAFWNMGSDDQAELLEQLALVIREDNKTNRSAYSLGELQWHFLAHDLQSRREAREILMSMAAPLYLNVLRATGGA